MRSNEKRRMMCRDCGHKAEAESFGLYMRCPRCGSEEVLAADIWEAFTDPHDSTNQDEPAPTP